MKPWDSPPPPRKHSLEISECGVYTEVASSPDSNAGAGAYVRITGVHLEIMQDWEKPLNVIVYNYQPPPKVQSGISLPIIPIIA